MDTLAAFAMGQAARARGDKVMVFDWDKAAKIIVKSEAAEASAGLSGDWDWTGCEIYRDHRPVPEDDTYVYLASNWAAPKLEINGRRIECWRYRDGGSDWDAHAYWPESALAILPPG